ncbi:MAG: DUF2075 domain-containing protein [Phycisphaeraceae bacterium]|nr:DUF2075 domain-containing protein [Phycisphaeraceae bacterium]
MTEDSSKHSPLVASRAAYWAPVADFLRAPDAAVLAALVRGSDFAVETAQRDAWIEQVSVMRMALAGFPGGGFPGGGFPGAWIGFEYAVPRVGKRIDTVVVAGGVLFVIEFKVGESQFTAGARNQVWDYALDLRNFHSTSHDKPIAPILVATRAPSALVDLTCMSDHDGVFRPMQATPDRLADAMQAALDHSAGPDIDAERWAQGRYQPTPTIIEAARALYGGHGVEAISRNDASAINLSQTSEAIAAIIRASRDERHKSICFVTGVPGAGKTLVGLNIATQHVETDDSLYSVFLSGNGPLVAVLREALARDKAERQSARGERGRLGEARSAVKAFIQNVHNFRDECLVDEASPPIEHVTLFDEAQRAWNLE